MKKILTMVLALVAALIVLALILKYAPTKNMPTSPKSEVKKPAPSQVETPPVSAETLKQYKEEANKYEQNIETYKVRLNDNIKKLSNKKWLNRSYEDLVGISEADLKIIQENNSLIYYMQASYLTLASIKVTKLNDKEGASTDLKDFKKIIASNKYVVQSDEILRVVNEFEKKWDL